jgi:hypothetical protein
LRAQGEAGGHDGSRLSEEGFHGFAFHVWLICFVDGKPRDGVSDTWLAL